MEFREITDPAIYKTIYPLIKEVRAHLTLDVYLEIITEAVRRDDYKIVAAYDGDRLLGAMGFRILFDFVHGKHLYVDDLVVCPELRSKGIGSQILKQAEQWAAKLGCRIVRLSTGTENGGARRFYEREGWSLRSVTFKKRIEP